MNKGFLILCFGFLANLAHADSIALPDLTKARACRVYSYSPQPTELTCVDDEGNSLYEELAISKEKPSVKARLAIIAKLSAAGFDLKVGTWENYMFELTFVRK